MEGLFNLLLITPAVNNLVNGSIHHGSLRKGYTLPAVRMNVSTSSFITTAQSTADLQYQTIQFDCIASEYLDALRLKDAVKSLLKDYTGTLVEGTAISASWLVNEIDNPLGEGLGGYTFRSMLTLKFAYDASGLSLIAPIPNVVLDIDDVGLPQMDTGN
jgi:hypothetical protein